MTTIDAKISRGLADRKAKARTTKSNEEMLGIINKESNFMVVRALMENPHLTQDVQDIVAGGKYPAAKADRYHTIPLALIDHTDVITEKTIRALAFNKVSSVRSQIIGLAQFPQDMQDGVTRDADPIVRLKLAERDDLIKRVEQELLRDADKRVVVAIKRKYHGRNVPVGYRGIDIRDSHNEHAPETRHGKLLRREGED